MTTENWQKDVIVRDLLEARCLISRIANKLYPEILSAKSREMKLLEIPEMIRLADICSKEIKALSKERAEWRENNKEPA